MKWLTRKRVATYIKMARKAISAKIINKSYKAVEEASACSVAVFFVISSLDEGVNKDCIKSKKGRRQLLMATETCTAVSYTHLTLPTILLV